MKRRLREGEVECSFCGEPIRPAQLVDRTHRCDPLIQIEVVIRWAVFDVLQRWTPGGKEPAESPEQRALRERRETAAKFISRFATPISWQQILRYEADFEVAYRHAAIRCHPDRADLGGNTALFQQLQEHARVLKELHGIR